MARHRPSEEEPPEGEPEVQFEPSPQMVEAVNQPAAGEPAPEGEAPAEAPAPTMPPEGMEYLAVGRDPAVRAEAEQLDIAGTYEYTAEGGHGSHVQLGELVQGERYEYTNELHAEAKAAVKALVDAGVLKKVG